MAAILFLDDCPDRIRTFMLFHPTAIVTSSSTSMIEILSCIKEISYLFLDHDLFGEDLFVPGVVKGTGMEVVEWLEHNKLNIFQIIVHSRNGIAAPIMLDRLLKANYPVVGCPFPLLVSQFFTTTKDLNYV